MLNLTNLTPHVVTLRGAEGDIHLPPAGYVARVDSEPGSHASTLMGIPVYTMPEKGRVVGLPERRPGEIYLVSGMVLAALSGKDRPDVVAPGTGPNDGAIRDEQGRIVAVTRLLTVA